jgi:SnoaL-like domain
MTTAPTDTTKLAEVVELYLAMWNEEDAAARAALVARAWAPDGHYVDPLLEARGHVELDAMVAGVQAGYPGHRFRATSGVDAHHDEFRVAWELVAPDGSVTVAGIDAGAVAADGRLARITGFFGPLT